jgi:hypothetical protein
MTRPMASEKQKTIAQTTAPWRQAGVKAAIAQKAEEPR